MKITKLLLLVLSLGSPSVFAKGVITDVFECQAKIVDLVTNESAESSGSTAGARMNFPLQQAANYQESAGFTTIKLRLKGSRALYLVDLNLHYGFAQRPISNPTEARQYTCGQLSLSACPTASSSQGSCSSTSQMCAVGWDPFDSKYGWGPTNLLQDVAVFNEQLLRPLDTILPLGPSDPNGARVTVSCKLQGTYF